MEEIIKLEVDHFKRKLKDCSLWCRKIIRCNLELEVISVKMYEIGAIDTSREINQRDPYRTPTNNIFYWSEKEREWTEKKEGYEKLINECRIVLNRIDPILKDVLVRMEVSNENHEILARKINRSRTQMYRDIEDALAKKI